MCRENITSPLNTNPGLEVHRGTNFSGIKLFFTCLVLCCLRLLELKTANSINRKPHREGNKNEIKSLANLGLA